MTPTTPDALWAETLGDALTGHLRTRDLSRLDDPDNLPEDGAPARFLPYAAALSVIRRANGVRKHSSVEEDGAVCPPNTRKEIPHEAARQLQKILNSTTQAFLPDWLRLCEAGGFAAPPEYLPELLELARRKMNLRLRILPLLDTRGAWLAARNGDWAFANPDRWEDLWQNSGGGREKPNLLRTIRRLEPARGRELSAKSWADDSAAMRVRLLEVLEENLGPDDEPFLEERLQDAARTVRRQAALHLAALPEGRLAREAAEAAEYLEFGGAIPENLPELGEEFALIEGDLSGFDLSPADTRLAALLSVAPLDYWEDREKARPVQLLETVAESAQVKAWWTGWLTAVQRRHNSRWLNGVLEILFIPGGRRAHLKDLGKIAEKTQVLELPQRMPAGACDEILLKILGAYRNPLHDKHPLLELLSLNPDLVISPALGKGLLRSIERHIIDAPSNSLQGWNLTNYLKELGRKIPPAAVDPQKRWPTMSPHWPKWQAPIEKFVKDVKERRKLHEAFATPVS